MYTHLTMQKRNSSACTAIDSNYLEPEVITGAVRHFELFQCFATTTVLGIIQGINELVKNFDEHCCLPGIFSTEELNSLCNCVAEDLKEYEKVHGDACSLERHVFKESQM